MLITSIHPSSPPFLHHWSSRPPSVPPSSRRTNIIAPLCRLTTESVHPFSGAGATCGVIFRRRQSRRKKERAAEGKIKGRTAEEPPHAAYHYSKNLHVTLRYSPSLPGALKDVSFIIAGGMQARIVGRTGAGKSSILNTIFHLNPICQGRILVDGINIADASIRDLRSHFSVVPKSPFLFEGSLRDNLDPFRVSDDLQIWKTLEKCHVKEEVEAAGGLDARIKQSGTSFFVGQRQLFALPVHFESSKVRVKCP
ncbi:hypothetical protein U1Q18_029669 [Sarracenia purpurea var. burkii]